MKRIALIIMVASAALLSSCGTSVDITYDYDRSVDFTKFSTFAIAEWNEDNSELVNDFSKIRMQNAMRTQMELRGLTEVKENPDILVDIFVVTTTEEYTTAYTSHVGSGYGGWGGYGMYGYGYGYGGMGYGTSSTQYVEHEKLMGTIIVDVYDERTKKLAWQGIAKGEVEQDSELNEKDINNVMNKIFYKYPVKKK